jgi:hypothetical protein
MVSLTTAREDMIIWWTHKRSTIASWLVMLLLIRKCGYCTYAYMQRSTSGLREYRLEDFIIVGLIMVIVKIVFFRFLYDWML